ncbi:MAG: hypothetical protein AMJ78_10765 [Omnitrophica WOR_2 bacterium SM23_29]|nr:MAG: hypothetical protein AMJ78_10765 [Omnitrophica WOR_2 bacterium SM23_29]
MKNWLFKNFWLKAISLVLAIITWFYVVGELSHTPGEERLPFWFGYAPGNVIKQVQIIPMITGRPATGYVLRADKITIKPNATFIIGPKRIVDKLISLKTVPIDITSQTKTYNVTVPLESIKGVRFYGAGGIVDIIIPIEKAQQP